MNDASACVCQEKGTDCYANRNCSDQMHKHDLILYVFYVTGPFNLYGDSNNYCRAYWKNCFSPVREKSTVVLSVERPISFISQKLTDTQRRWAMMGKETCMIV